MTRRVVLAVVAAVALLGGLSSPAGANHNANGPQTTGGVVINSCQSEGSIYVTAQRPVDSYTVVPTCKASNAGSRPILRNVQGFKVSAGYNAINTKTGYVYVGGQWHYMCCNNTTLSLRVDWLGNNSAVLAAQAAAFTVETAVRATMLELAA